MPLNKKGKKIKKAMEKEYGKEKGERVFYASRATVFPTIEKQVSAGNPAADNAPMRIRSMTNVPARPPIKPRPNPLAT